MRTAQAMTTTVNHFVNHVPNCWTFCTGITSQEEGGTTGCRAADVWGPAAVQVVRRCRRGGAGGARKPGCGRVAGARGCAREETGWRDQPPVVPPSRGRTQSEEGLINPPTRTG